MTNEELKKKICEIIAPYVSAWGEDERIADALIAAGIGDVWEITEKAEKAIVSLIKQNKEAEHRAERAERALDRACEKVFLLSDNCRYSNLKDDVRDSIKLRRSDVENFIAVVREKFLQQAEKELAEEGK